MLPSASNELEAVRFSTADALENYIAGAPLQRASVSRQAAIEETFFLGLRLTRGVDLEWVRRKFGAGVITALRPVMEELASGGFLEREGDWVRLTQRGRLVSNEVFERFLTCGEDAVVR
jgi:oxygen-independent coproporphyrinogen-3 oxidase